MGKIKVGGNVYGPSFLIWHRNFFGDWIGYPKVKNYYIKIR